MTILVRDLEEGQKNISIVLFIKDARNYQQNLIRASMLRYTSELLVFE